MPVAYPRDRKAQRNYLGSHPQGRFRFEGLVARFYHTQNLHRLALSHVTFQKPEAEVLVPCPRPPPPLLHANSSHLLEH